MEIRIKLRVDVIMLLLLVGVWQPIRAHSNIRNQKTPVVVITDLYNPAQDVGDNFDLMNAYLLPEIDLKAVLIDCHNTFRNRVAVDAGAGLHEDKRGPREPGYSTVEQLNYIFDRNVPYGVGPFSPMRSIDDKMEDISVYESKGLELLQQVLEEVDLPVTVVSFGSLRILAVANNRFPDLLKEKIKEVHICAGTSYNHPEFLEWNVALDTTAFVSVLRSDLPINLYPCASGAETEASQRVFRAFLKDENNTFYRLSDMGFMNQMPDKLKHYIHHAFSRTIKPGYLSMLDSVFRLPDSVFNLPHRLWETAIWMQVAGLKMVEKSNGVVRIISESNIAQDDGVLVERLRSCDIQVMESGLFTYDFDPNGRFRLYEREDPVKYQKWMNIALPEFYVRLAKQMSF